jgi:hypothetical protein
MTSNHAPILDDERASMTMGERTTWVYGVLVLLTTGAYFAVVLPRLADTPVAEIAWQVPMLVAIGVVIAGTIVGTIVSAIVAAIISRDLRQESDIRDTQISQYGERSNLAVIGAGIAAVLVLTMLELDQFWVGSALFAVGALGATWANATKIRAYRRSFHG